MKCFIAVYCALIKKILLFTKIKTINKIISLSLVKKKRFHLKCTFKINNIPSRRWLKLKSNISKCWTELYSIGTHPAECKVNRYAISTKFCGTSARWQTYTSFDGLVNRRLQKSFRNELIKTMKSTFYKFQIDIRTQSPKMVDSRYLVRL